MICRTRKELIDTRPRRAFISYAHVEEPWKERLVKAFEPLKGDGFVETWHDGMLLPGERWHPRILSALADAELVFLLVSPALLESEYARETEIPLAVQRADMGRIRLVPVLLQSCEWTKEPFAKYQALPDDKLPIAERSDVDEALDDCLERLRRVFAPPELLAEVNQTDVSLLRIIFEIPSSVFPNGSALIGAVRQIWHEGDVRTNFVQRVPAGYGAPQENRWEWLLEGSPRAFSAIENSHRLGHVSHALGVNVISVDRTVGASYFAGTYLVAASQAPPPLNRMLSPGSPSEPPRLFGIAVRPSDPDWVLPFFTKAGNDIEGEEWEREKQKLLGYFYTVLAVPGEDLHVNLSTFEKGRVMPATLARTDLGRLLAEQDCLLKQLTASMLHPRTPDGLAFWQRIESLARQSGKQGSLEMWQKVWIVAGDATLNEKAAGETYDHPLPPGYEIRQEDWFGHLSDCSMRVMCETDYLALEKRSEQSHLSVSPEDPFHEQALAIFRETILPGLIAEVNTGSHFAPLRQAYYGVALAKWYREHVAARGAHTRLIEAAAQMRASLGNSSEIGPGPDAPEWMSNCFERYLQLLDGVFRVTEPGVQEEAEPRRVRIYHSGSVSFC